MLGQTATEAEASHHLIYNITDTWQIPQHYVSTPPLSLTLSAAPAGAESQLNTRIHPIQSVVNQRETYFLRSVNKLPALSHTKQLHVQTTGPMQSYIQYLCELNLDKEM